MYDVADSFVVKDMVAPLVVVVTEGVVMVGGCGMKVAFVGPTLSVEIFMSSMYQKPWVSTLC